MNFSNLIPTLTSKLYFSLRLGNRYLGDITQKAFCLNIPVASLLPNNTYCCSPKIQEIKCQFLTTEAWVHEKVRSYWICGGRNS
jgi:hypothetical protein